MTFGDKTFDVISIDEVISEGPRDTIGTLMRGDIREHALFLSAPREDTVRRQPSTSQKESSHENLIILALWVQTSSLQNGKKKNVGCLSYSVYGILI